MTASDDLSPQRIDELRAIAERALDLFVYLPAGAVATALDDMPSTAAKGRARLERQLRNAHVVGRFAVDFGLRQVKSQMDAIGSARRSPPPSSAPVQPSPRAPSAARDPDVDRAIPDYDALSASQVVRRLGGLDAGELAAIRRHELATRARRTILQKVGQLLTGTSADPAPPRATSAP